MEPAFQQMQLLRFQLNKLQAYKSSFQAWKCVSFGYALLAVVLLLSKWHEVATDLALLTSVDQLLWANGTAATFPLAANTSSVRESASNDSLPLGMLLLATGSGQNSSGGLADEQAEGTAGQRANSSAALVSHHMELLAGRELNAGQLMRQEVEAFLVEFRSAKSTLGLSSLLVLVYIISWLLMTLAVNDTRISNDVSMRNILLLSVFGAIDMAASCGFVMVRLIMFNVKSRHFVSEMLGSVALRDSPIQLTADQLTAFTALRLIAIRSCSAYIDVYVSVLVALLTLLRLYAIVRAIAYYRFLRRFNDSTRNQHHRQQLAAALHSAGEEKPRQLVASYDNGAFSQEQGAKSIWQLSGQQASMSPGGPFVQQAGQPLYSARASPVQQFQLLEPQVILTSPTGQTTTYVASSQQTTTAHPQQHTLRSLSLRPASTSNPALQQLFQSQPQVQHANTSKHRQGLVVDTRQQQQQQRAQEEVRATSSPSGEQTRLKSTNQPLLLATATNAPRPPLVDPVARARHKLAHHQPPPPQPQTRPTDAQSSAPRVLLLNGRAHQLVAADSDQEGARHPLRPPGETTAHNSAGFESEPVAHRVRKRAERDANNNNQPAASFTLLSASQLDKLSRRLMARATTQPADGERAAAAARNPLSNYKLVARYRPVRAADSKARTLGSAELAVKRRRQLTNEPAARSSSSDDNSSSSASTCEGLAELAELHSDATGRQRAPPHERKGRLKKSRARLLTADLRQTEEFSLGPPVTRDNRELLLQKYYYA